MARDMPYRSATMTSSRPALACGRAERLPKARVAPDPRRLAQTLGIPADAVSTVEALSERQGQRLWRPIDGQRSYVLEWLPQVAARVELGAYRLPSGTATSMTPARRPGTGRRRGARGGCERRGPRGVAAVSSEVTGHASEARMIALPEAVTLARQAPSPLGEAFDVAPFERLLAPPQRCGPWRWRRQDLRELCRDGGGARGSV